MTLVSPANEEAIEAWDGPLFDRFVQFRDIVTDGLGAHGEAALARAPAASRATRVLDIGCGFGDTAQRPGADGRPGGVGARRRCRSALHRRRRARRRPQAGVANVRFEVADVEIARVRGGVRLRLLALRNDVLRQPGRRAAQRARRARARAASSSRSSGGASSTTTGCTAPSVAVKDYLEKNEESDEPTCGPGPFSMANADTVSDILLAAGFEDIRLRANGHPDHDRRPTSTGAIEFVCALGPAGEVIRLAGDAGRRDPPDDRGVARRGAGRVRRPGRRHRRRLDLDDHRRGPGC